MTGTPLPQAQDEGGVDMAAIIRHFVCLSQAWMVFRIGRMQGDCAQLVQLRLKIAEHK